VLAGLNKRTLEGVPMWRWRMPLALADVLEVKA